MTYELPPGYDAWKSSGPPEDDVCENCDGEGCGQCEEDPDRKHDQRNDEPERDEDRE